MTTEREALIDKLSDEMDRDNATAFVDRVIREAIRQGEHEDLKETVHRLESLVIDLRNDVRQLRKDLGR